MTIRSILLGLLGAVFICGTTYFNDRVLHQTDMIGNNLPVSVYGILILFLLGVAPLLGKRSLRGKELAVIMTLTLAACCIPGSGLLRFFTPALVMPHHYSRTEPGWRDEHILDQVPKIMLADVSADEDRVVDGFRQGLSHGDRHISPAEIPWQAWWRAIGFWSITLLTLWFALLALSLVFHRQWSQGEHLPYPIAAFTNSLLPAEGTRLSPLFRRRLFWLGTLLVLGFHLNNFACRMFPDFLIPIRRQFDFGALHVFLPALVRGGGYGLLRPVVYFSVVGIAYFIPSDVSLSLGLGPFLWFLVVGLLLPYGIQLDQVLEGKGWYMSLRGRTFLLFGANLALFLSILYTGRHHLTNVFRRCLGLRSRDEVSPSEVRAGRIFLLLSLVLLLQMRLVGIAWPFGAAYIAVLIVFFVVMGRLIAETGLFYMQPYFFPCVVIWGMVGVRTLGVRTLLLLQMFSMILVVDPRESLIAFASNSLKLIELRGVNVGRATRWSAVAVVLGLLVAVPTCLYIQYDQGSIVYDAWGYGNVPKFPFDNAVAIKRKLASQGLPDGPAGTSVWSRLRHLSPNRTCMAALLAGFAAAAICSACRLRFRRWPIHPLLFVTWATYPTYLMCASFLLGWLIKTVVVKYGGMQLYQRLKPLMVGILTGEILGAVFPSIVGAIYYLITNKPPVAFHVLP